MSITNKLKSLSIEDVWFYLLILSFSYEKPLAYLTTMDRVNPRIYDIVTILGLVWFMNHRKPQVELGIVYTSYRKIVQWFAVCTIVGSLFYSFPSDISIFSYFYLFRYIQELFICLLVIYYINVKGVDFEMLFNVIILGGIFVSIYCIQEYLNSEFQMVEIAPGKTIPKPAGFVWGPFTAGYFQIANYSPVIGFLTVCYAFSRKDNSKWLYMVIAALILWPSFVSGSRMAIGLIVLLFSLAALKNKQFTKILLSLLIIGVIFYIWNSEQLLALIFDSESQTVQRMIRMEESDKYEFNSVGGRIMHLFEWFKRIGEYVYDGIFLPFFGGGFYVAPMKGVYRIGYGWHNIFIFAIEQSGIIGLWLFWHFIKRSYNELKKRLPLMDKESPQYWFAFGAFYSFIAMLIIGILGGHSFWRGFSTGNLNTFRILLLIITTHAYLVNPNTLKYITKSS